MVSKSNTLLGERRQLTVVFSDIVGSTQLSAQLDPEDWHGILSRYHQMAAEIVRRFEGHIHQYLGDGILILFGYPRAHENDAERAVRTGLGLLEEMSDLNKQIQKEFGKTIAVRIGIHTGEVMIRPEGTETSGIFGETPNVAARIQAEAKPDTVYISSATQRLVAGFFVVEELGPHILKGVPDPLSLFRVQRASGVRSRLHAASRSDLTPFVGREHERNILMNRWTLAQKGKGQLIMITGEAGIGKSRLLQQFKGDLGGIPHTWIEGESSPYEQDTPFAPTLDLIQNALGWNSETTLEEKLESLHTAFNVIGMDPFRVVPLIAGLFGLSLPPNRYAPLLLSPEQQRLQLLQTLVDWVIRTSQLQPTVLVVEDLHFADPSTLEEFVMLGEQIEDIPLMLVFTARPRFAPPWPSRPYHTLININRLEADSIREMISGLLGKLVPEDTLSSLIERTDGNPLFAEELSQTVAGVRNDTTTVQQIPSSLQDLLMARLDYIGASKEVAQMGSVLGRSFTYPLLAAIASQNESDLNNSLDTLTASGLVFVETSGGERTYTFKHALVSEAAYSSMLKSRRRELHKAAAAALTQKFPEISRQRPELIAHHLTEAGETEAALEAWQFAGDFASSRSAFKEALKHYKKGLELLNTIPETPERAFLELPLQTSLGRVLQVTEGFGGNESRQAFSRARVVAAQMGDSLQFQIILLGLWGTLNSQSEIAAGHEISLEMLRLAQQSENDMMLTWAYETQAIEAFAFGNFAEVPGYFEELSRHYRSEDHTWSPSDPKVTTSIHMSLALWHLGHTDQGREIVRASMDLAKDMAVANVAMSYLGACSFSLATMEADALMENALELLRIARENDLPNYISWGNIYRGAALIHQKEFQPGIELLAQGVGEYLATGTHSSLAQYLGVLALGYAGAGNLEHAFASLEDAFGAAGEELMHLPELNRIRGSLFVQKNMPQEAEEAFRESIAISRKFGSLVIELRASTHLGRLLQSSGRSSEARALLAPLYAKFEEGFDTPDMKNAKQLLDDLSK